MGIIIILIVLALLISAVLSYCAAYYKAFYLLKEVKASKFRGDSSKIDNKKTDDAAEKISEEVEKEDVAVTTESKTDSASKDADKNNDEIEKKIENEKDEENVSTSESKQSDSINDEKESSNIILKSSVTKLAPFFKIKDNLPQLKKNIILFFSIFSVLAILTTIIFYEKSTAVKAIQYILYSDCLFLIATIDFKVKKIPNKLILFLLCLRVFAIFSEFLFDGKELHLLFIYSGIGMAVGAITVFVCLLVSRGGIGAGDLKMFAVIGFYFGLQGLMEIMIYSLFFASIVGIILLISRKAKFKSSLAMAPFMFIGSMLHILML